MKEVARHLDRHDTPPARPGSRFAFIGVIALLFGFAAFESGTAIANDDFGYLMWGLQTRDDLFAWVRGPEWFSYRRPLNALIWWMSAQTGIDAELARWFQVLLWTAFGAALLSVVRNSVRSMVTLTLLLVTNQVFVDLLQWRSWMTTTGSLAFLSLAVLAVERRASALNVALLGAVALGFKEVAVLAVAVIALSRPGYRYVGAVLVAGLCASAWSSAHKIGLHFLVDNLRFHVETVALFAPAVPVLVAVRFPKLPTWAFGVPGLIVVLPMPLQAAAVALSAGMFLSGERRWGAAVTVALGVPLLGAQHARQYLLESWAVILIALAASKRLSVSPMVWLAMVVLALPSAVDFESNRRRLRQEFEEQLEFLHDFRPAPASQLYHPDVIWSWDLDALYWVQHGATLNGRPPPGTNPVQVGPLSGVWADTEPGHGSGSR